jgi:hypothetical protein
MEKRGLKENKMEKKSDMTIRVERPHPPLVIQSTGITILGNRGMGCRDLITFNHQNNVVSKDGPRKRASPGSDRNWNQ